MNILLTNDDGWDAVGMNVLRRVLEDFGELYSVAPSLPQSGISHQMTFERPMKLTEIEPRHFHLNGTPADCSRVGLTHLGVDFDWVFSGVNNGGNLGVDFFVSGTVAAAREATFFGVQSAAISQHRLDYPAAFDWPATIPLVRRVVQSLLDRKGSTAAKLTCINLPDCTQRNLESVELIDCELDSTPLPCDYKVEGKGSQKVLTYCGVYNQRERIPGRDVDVCMSGNVSITSFP